MGKSTFVNDFLKNWPNYTKGPSSFRQKVQEKLGKDKNGTEYRSLSKLGNRETQELIRDSMIDDISKFTRKDNVIYDRGLFDNIMYSLYLCGRGIVDCDGEWMEKQLPILREGFKFYDIILFIPLLTGYSTPVIPAGNADLDRDIIFRSECNNIFVALQKQYLDGARTYLPRVDTPAILEIYGNPKERVEMCKLYINERGAPYGEDTSLITEHLQDGLKFLEEYEKMDTATKELITKK